MINILRPRPRAALPAGAAIVVLAAASTLTVAAASGAFTDHPGGRGSSQPCAVPALAGSQVSASLLDMRNMMARTTTGGGMMSSGPLMGQNDWPRFRRGMMRVTLTRTSVPHGTVSVRVHNAGYLTHELVVLPLAAGQAAGTRTPGSDGKVSENGSLGEASASCAAGTGHGITAGSSSWVTLKLPAGRYEIICNLPGHYAAGMHTELVTA